MQMANLYVVTIFGSFFLWDVLGKECDRFQKQLVLKYWSILHERNTQPSAIAHHVGSSNSLHHR